MNQTHLVQPIRRTGSLPVPKIGQASCLSYGAAALMALLVAGCGSSRIEVSGTVRLNGKPLSHGTIQFLGEDGVPCSAEIGQDGTYSLEMPTGQAKVIVSCVDEVKLKQVTTQMAATHGRSAPPASSASKLSLIPQRYADWSSSGLTVLVQGDRTVKDFSLTSK
jgi:hypothetical protein